MYDLCSLGWNSFQQLCHTITREILGQTVESFLDSHDGGRDGAFAGKWRGSGEEDLSGSFVIQCKFTSRANYSLGPTDVSTEVEKAARLVQRGFCTSYVLMTNAGVTGNRALEISELFKSVGVEQVRVFGSTWISQQILENKRLRLLVPRMYGLGDLSQILDERIYAQARSILESMREDLAKVVVTDAYRRSADAIDKHGFVLLIGEPASGKTTIASLLSMAALDQWDASILKLDDPGDVVKHWNPNEGSQFFWLDDAFGVTQYEESSVLRWNHVLPRIEPMLLSGAKIVMTSRDYIYKHARKKLKGTAFPLLNESQVVIDVHDLSGEEKEQILYNHIKLGNQARCFRTKIKRHLQRIASHPRFIPEIARRLGNSFFTKDLVVNASSISDFVQRREQLLLEILQGLDTDSRAALALIYMRNGRLDSPIRIQPSETLALERLGSSIGRCIDALDALRDSLVLLSFAGGESVWRFRHPTVGDACAVALGQSPEHIDILIQGSKAEDLLYEVTCGDLGVESAVVVPQAFFPEMVEKLRELQRRKSRKSESLSIFGPRGNLHIFLAYRCSKEFLSLYLPHDPELLDKVSEPGLSLGFAPEVSLAKRLHEFRLLPEENRRRFVQTVSEYALEGHDGGALSDEGIRSIFTDLEYEDFVRRLRGELLPRLDEVRYDWEYYHSDESPSEYMQPLLEFFNSLQAAFADDDSAIELIDQELWQTTEWIDENTVLGPESPSRELGIIETTTRSPSTRSIFDDIDADSNP